MWGEIYLAQYGTGYKNSWHPNVNAGILIKSNKKGANYRALFSFLSFLLT